MRKQNSNAFLESCSTIADFEFLDKPEIESQRFVLGTLKFIVTEDLGKKILYTDLSGVLYITMFIESNLSLMNLVFSGLEFDCVTFLQDNAQRGILTITDPHDQTVLLNEYVKGTWGIEMSGNPKSCLAYYSSKPQEVEALYLCILSHQSKTGYIENRIVSKKYKEFAADDVSQYEGVKIYMSDCCVIQHYDKNFVGDIEARNMYLALTVFMVELIVLRTHSLERLSQELKQLITDGTLTSKNLVKINREILLLNQIWNSDYFVYPITQHMSETMSSRFLVEKQISQFTELKKSFENYAEILRSSQADRNNRILNNILVILAFLQLIPTVLSLTTITTNPLINNAIVAIVSLISLVLLIGLVRINRRR